MDFQALPILPSVKKIRNLVQGLRREDLAVWPPANRHDD